MASLTYQTTEKTSKKYKKILRKSYFLIYILFIVFTLIMISKKIIKSRIQCILLECEKTCAMFTTCKVCLLKKKCLLYLYRALFWRGSIQSKNVQDHRAFTSINQINLIYWWIMLFFLNVFKMQNFQKFHLFD